MTTAPATSVAGLSFLRRIGYEKSLLPLSRFYSWQVDHNDIPLQRIACREYAERNGWTIIREFYEMLKVRHGEAPSTVEEIIENAVEKVERSQSGTVPIAPT